MGNFLKYVNQSNKKKEDNKKTSNSQLGNFGKYAIGKTLGLDTLQSDLANTIKSIGDAYNGWQTRETMDNTLSSVQNMYDRLGKYQEYQKQYGGTDLSELLGGLESAIGGWKDLSVIYGKYKDAKSYDKAMKEAQIQNEKLTSADVGALDKELSQINSIYEKASEYQSKIDKIKSLNMVAESRSFTAKGTSLASMELSKAEKELSEYLKSVGYDSYDSLKKTLGEKQVFKTNAQRVQDLIAKTSVGDKTSENYDKDYDKYVDIGMNISADEVGKSKRIRSAGSRGRLANTPVTNDNLREAALAAERRKNGEKSDTNNIHSKSAIYDLMTDNELKDLYYYMGKDKEDGGNRAYDYLDAIEETLNIRRSDEISKIVENTPWGEFGFMVESGLDQWASGVRSNFVDKDYIPPTAIQYASDKVRDNVEYEYGDFARTMYDFGVTASNQLPSIYVSTLLGVASGGLAGAATKVASGVAKGAGLATMGISARGSAYQEMLNLGYNKDQANTYANLVGASEVGLQALLGGISKLGGTSAKVSKLVEGINNGFARFAIQFPLSVASESLEEGLQEVLTPLFTNIAAGYDTGAEVDWGEVAYSALLGGLMGGLFEGPGVVTENINRSASERNVGKVIKANNKVGDFFDILSNPEIGSAYEAYTKLAEKGATTDNISNSNLGKLYARAKRDATNTLNSETSTDEQRDFAFETSTKLAVFENEIGFKEKVKSDHNIGEKTEVTYNGETVDIKNAKIKNGDLVVETKEGEASVDDLTLTQSDAEFATIAQGIAKTDGDDVANLFLSQYDGKTDIDDYARSFGLMSMYANHLESFTEEHVLENKGALSTDTAKAIYNGLIVANSKIKKANASIKASAENVERGTINESIFNYGKDYVPGKVNWNNLADREKMAVVFAKGLYKKLGSNLSFLYKETEFNGMYDVGKDMTYVDVYAGKSTANWTGKDFIISTIAHELTHEMEVKSPETFKQLAELVLSSLEKSPDFKGKTRNDIIAEEIERLKKKGGNHTDADAISEIVARACEDLLAESKEAKAMFKSLSPVEQKTLVEKIKDLIQKVVDWIDEFLSTYKNQSKSAEAKALRKMKETFAEMLTLWDSMLLDVQKYNQALEKSNADENKADGDMKLAIREEFSSEIDAWAKDGKKNGETFILGTTGDVLQGLGAIESDIYMLSKKINEILNDHPEMTIDEIKKIPQILENPILILKSKNVGRDDADNTRLVIFGNIKAKDGRPILTVLDLKPVENNLAINDMQKVSSAYTKDVKPVEFIEESLVVYADKKRTTKLLRTIGFNAPIELQLSGYIGSISYPGQNVNINGEKFSNVFKDVKQLNSDRDSNGRELSEGQMEYFKDSTVRDEDGKLLVMYRGDSNEFTVFDRKKSKYSNLYGRGFYFTKNKAHAEQYGQAKEFYLDIKNPLSKGQNSITKEQMLNFLKAIENDGEDYDLYNYGQEATAETVLNSVWGKGDFEMIQDINAGAIGDLVAAVELFNEVNGTTYDGIVLPTETVTFESEQAKLTSNLNPTKDKDIRFSMRDNVEETRDLVAVHNMQSSELERTLDLGGLPMPSIAIIKAESGHSEYGDVSLVFDKSVIDPKSNKANKVYGG